MREIAGLRLDPFRREVFRDGRYVALTRKQFAVLEVLVGAEGGVVSAEELLERAWDENADPFTNAVRITVSALRKRLGEPWVIATVPRPAASAAPAANKATTAARPAAPDEANAAGLAWKVASSRRSRKLRHPISRACSPNRFATRRPSGRVGIGRLRL